MSATVAQADSEQGGKMVRATFDAEELRIYYRRIVRSISEGAPAVVRYDSRFGGEQEVSAPVEVETNYMDSPKDLTVGGRRLNIRTFTQAVESADSDRTVGDLDELEVVMPFEDVLEMVAHEWEGHDVDAGGETIIIQMWQGSGDDLQGGELRLAVED